jgi:hypothetical protein
MAEPGVIAEYVERLARNLDFDPSLSRRVRREVEDHLYEAVSTSRSADRGEAERRPVANFGDPHVIAAQFAVVSVAKQARRVGTVGLLLIAAVFIAMKARLTWYATLAYQTGTRGAFSETVISIDRYAFWLALFVGVASSMYIESRRIPAALTPEYRTQLRRFRLLCLTATGALIATVVSDGVLTLLRLAGALRSFDVVVPLVSMTIEVGCAVGLVFSIRRMTQRTASAERASRA